LSFSLLSTAKYQWFRARADSSFHIVFIPFIFHYSSSLFTVKTMMSIVWLLHCLTALVMIFPWGSAAAPIPGKYVPFVQEDSVEGGPSTGYHHSAPERRAVLQKRVSTGVPPENPSYRIGSHEIKDLINLTSNDQFIDYTMGRNPNHS
jgi:hypothetical protein